MTLYRARVAISLGERVLTAGSLVMPGVLSARATDRLIRRGVLAQVQTPPLAVLPGWQHRSKRLLALGIVDAEQALLADVDEVARHCGVSPGLVVRWQAELIRWLAPPSPPGG